MKNVLVEKNSVEHLERKKQRIDDNEFSPIEAVKNTNDSFLSCSSHSTPLTTQQANKINCTSVENLTACRVMKQFKIKFFFSFLF